MTRLHEIPKEIDNFESRLIHNEGELTPEMEQEWADLIHGSKERLEAATFVICRLDDDAEDCREEVRRLETRARSFEGNRNRLADRVLYALKAMGGKIQTALVTLSVGRSGKKLSVETKEGTDLAEIQKTHPGFVRVTYAPNLEAIKEAYGSISIQLDQEQEAEYAKAGEITQEVGSAINHRIMERRKELLKAANLPDCFIVRQQAGTEYLRIK